MKVSFQLFLGRQLSFNVQYEDSISDLVPELKKHSISGENTVFIFYFNGDEIEPEFSFKALGVKDGNTIIVHERCIIPPISDFTVQKFPKFIPANDHLEYLKLTDKILNTLEKEPKGAVFYERIFAETHPKEEEIYEESEPEDEATVIPDPPKSVSEEQLPVFWEYSDTSEYYDSGDYEEEEEAPNEGGKLDDDDRVTVKHPTVNNL